MDPDGHCSAPSVGQGQVGICIDLFIQARVVPQIAPGIGWGDNRGPASNNPNASYRQEIQIVVTPGQPPQMVKNDGGMSRATTYIPGLGIKTLEGKGSSDTNISKPTVDQNGTEHFSVNSIGINGLSSLPGAPKDAIQTTLNMSVTTDGKVGLDAGGMRTAYPSIEVYAYGTGGSARPIYQKTESGNVNDLRRKDQPIPAVAPH